ncbi:MAG: hypothetical protein HY432_03745 [Candidatus Liptonbacteria bacterium]|nr:hypothetical protein [Candidatus Liptonbacteria bacterium]
MASVQKRVLVALGMVFLVISTKFFSIGKAAEPTFLKPPPATNCVSKVEKEKVAKTWDRLWDGRWWYSSKVEGESKGAIVNDMALPEKVRKATKASEDVFGTVVHVTEYVSGCFELQFEIAPRRSGNVKLI